jgi:subtilisin family serine protease
VIAAGNDYFRHGSRQGMGYPSILREAVSVGAVYDANEGSFSYGDGAVARSTGPDRITPFSQRLHPEVNPNTRTDIFAPGAPVTSTGIQNDHGESVQHGTSQATPVTAGVILLMQEFYHRTTGQLPVVDDLVTWLRNGGVVITDGDDEDDNVAHTNLKFFRLDALSALEAVRRHLQHELFRSRVAFTESRKAAGAAQTSARRS